MFDFLFAPAAGNFSSADILVLVFVIGLAVRGAFRGIVKEVILIGGIILGIILSRAVGPSIGHSIAANNAHTDLLAAPVGHVAVFAVVFIITAVVAFFASRFIKDTKFGIPNRILGGLFGVLLGLIISGGILKVINAVLVFMKKTPSESWLTKIATGLVQALLGLKV